MDLECLINAELKLVDSWLCANKPSLNTGKSSFVIFHPSQKKLPFSVQLTICNKTLKEEKSIQYLGVILDNNLKWKEHVNYLMKKIKRNVGLLSKVRYFVDIKSLIGLYYALIYPLITYSLIAWGHTYESIINPLILLQKRTIRIITFPSCFEHSSPLFKSLKLIKLQDLVKICTAVFMFKFHNSLLPSTFNSFFVPVNEIHNYNTRLSSSQSYALSKSRTNYGIYSGAARILVRGRP